jgi:FkbM family methyltransferase
MKLSTLFKKIALELTKLKYPSYLKKVVQARIHDFDILVLANEDVGRSIAVFHRYEKRDSDLLKLIIKDGDVCIDAGANIGFYTLLMAGATPTGTVHSFEPMPLNWHLLNASVCLNGMKNIILNNVALGEKRGNSSFSASVDGAYSSMVDVGRKKESEKIIVSVETLDDYLAESNVQRVNIMKVDVEGAEGLVLNGARKLFSSDNKPRLVLLELFDENFKFYNTSVSDLCVVMKGYAYQAYVLVDSGAIEAFEERHYNKFYNVFFVLDVSTLKIK